MITEDYVSFETAKLLKEKGFDEPCTVSFFDKDSYREWIETAPRPLYVNDESTKPFTYQRPTLQMAMKWFREIHNIDINIYAESISHKKRYTISIWKNIQKDDAINDVILGISTIYEEACEAAIKYCLENLI